MTAAGEVGGEVAAAAAPRDAPPRVDVGVVTWNTADLTVSTLRGLLGTDHGCGVRLLVHDNGSTDGTAEALAAGVPEAVVERSTTNRGFAAGMNLLLARSDAPWFLALNSDASPEPGAIRRMLDAGAALPAAAAVAPRLERADGTVEHSTHPLPSLRTAAGAALGPRVIGRRRAGRMLLEGAWRHDRGRPVGWAVGAALLLRRAAVTEIGGFDERYFMYAEDLDWCWRAHRAGWTVWFEPSAVVRHVGNASGRLAYPGAARTTAYLRNTYRVCRRQSGLATSAGLRALNLAGSARMYAWGRLRRDPDMAAFWRAQLSTHVRPVPPTDGPPGR